MKKKIYITLIIVCIPLAASSVLLGFFAGRNEDMLTMALCAAGLLIFTAAALVPAAVILTRSIVRPIEKLPSEPATVKMPYKELETFWKLAAEQNAKKAENEKMRRIFTANVSHELKTPLTSISGYAEMIESGMARPEDTAEFAHKIHSEADRMLALIADIIRLSELEEPEPLKVERVDLLEVAQKAVELCEISALAKNVDIRLTGEHTYITGNAAMLLELAQNLCDNAVRYNNDGGSVWVSISAQQDPERAVFSVSDNGIGIPKKHQTRVFERFYRVDKSRSKATGGTGLGLAIVKHIAMRHDAEIELLSAEGVGTEITVTFCKKGTSIN